jgi:hypothetical protein
MTLADRSVRRQFTAAMALAMALALLLSGTALAQTTANEVEAVAIDDSCNDVPEDGFTDVPETNTFDDEIECLKGYGFTEGTGDGTTYTPNGHTRRWQMVQFVARLAQEADEQVDAFELPEASDQGFNDIDTLEQRFQDNINIMAEIGVVEGKDATTFDPFSNVKRDQMASFINRLQGAIQDALGGDDAGFVGTEDFFPDVPDDNVHKDNINGLAEVGIVQGKVDGDYDPSEFVTRGQMSAFIMRHYEVNVNAGVLESHFPPGGPLPEGIGGVLTAVDTAGDTYTFTSDEDEEIVVDYDTDNDVFYIDGTEATIEAFELALEVGDRISFAEDTTDEDVDYHFLVNTDAANDGMVGNVDIAATGLDIIEPVSGDAIAEYDYTDVTAPVTGNQYEVDGESVGEGDFEDALNEGDTVVIDTNDAGVRTFSLTNQTVSGLVDDIVGTTFQIDGLGDDPAGPADEYFLSAGANSVTVDGEAAVVADFQADLTIGDQATFARDNGVVTLTLVNNAPTDQAGTLTEDFDLVADTLELVDEDGVFTVDYTAPAAPQIRTLLVDGIVSTEAQFEAELTAGDVVVFRGADADSETDMQVSLTNSNLSGRIDDIDTTLETLDVVGPDDTELLVDDLDYSLAFYGGTAVYVVDGVEVDSIVEFNDALDNDATEDAVITVVDVESDGGTQLATEYRLTTE